MKLIFSRWLMMISPLFVQCQVEPVEILYTMPEESEPHEATWLQWPHEHQYGMQYRNDLDQTWVDMTKALATSEKVNIIAYDEESQERIEILLEEAGVLMPKVEFFIFKTDDVWVRDNGPIYARDKSGQLVVQDWGFNGWGEKVKRHYCDKIPEQIAKAQNIKWIDINKIMINEGGSLEIDGQGSMVACRSSILNFNRNNMDQEEAEEIFTKYLGVTNFIWLDGVPGLEITDMHIDGFARFGNHETIVTMTREDLREWSVPDEDIEILYEAKNKESKKYKHIVLPLTSEEVVKPSGEVLDYKGSYINYYIANTVILVPNYNDKNDQIANKIIQSLYPTRQVVGIDVRNLYANGGMIHCVTQQQPK